MTRAGSSSTDNYTVSFVRYKRFVSLSYYGDRLAVLPDRRIRRSDAIGSSSRTSIGTGRTSPASFPPSVASFPRCASKLATNTTRFLGAFVDGILDGIAIVGLMLDDRRGAMS
ncbi:hypothetical protein P5V15_004023 [Pogonomyrmex californicus]